MGSLGVEDSIMHGECSDEDENESFNLVQLLGPTLLNM